jgi:hypothetical protein
MGERDSDEPAILAGLPRDVIARQTIPEDRVFVAGLSAGAAIAVIVGGAYPDLFKAVAVGVNSGLPQVLARTFPGLRDNGRRRGEERSGPRCERRNGPLLLQFLRRISCGTDLARNLVKPTCLHPTTTRTERRGAAVNMRRGRPLSPASARFAGDESDAIVRQRPIVRASRSALGCHSRTFLTTRDSAEAKKSEQRHDNDESADDVDNLVHDLSNQVASPMPMEFKDGRAGRKTLANSGDRPGSQEHAQQPSCPNRVVRFQS